jgi:hypothetical protein
MRDKHGRKEKIFIMTSIQNGGDKIELPNNATVKAA